MYDSNLEYAPHLMTKGELADSLNIWGIVDRMYYVQGTMVIEYYEMNSGKFLGFAGDTSRFDFEKMPYFRQSPVMRRLVRNYGPMKAHRILQGHLIAGLPKNDVLDLLGQPQKRKKVDGQRVWIYPEMKVFFENGELVGIERQHARS